MICAVLFLGTTKNYMDRQVLSVLKPVLQAQFHWSEIDYSNLVFLFQVAYALGMLGVGWLVDRFGARIGYAVAMFLWSVASLMHAFAHSLAGFGLARFGLGFWEAGVFPAGIKAVAEWFPAKERALATGIFNAGTNLGAVLTPLLVPWIATVLGWRWAFFITGALGFAWIVLWLLVYRSPDQHPHCSQQELQYIREGSMGEGEGSIAWRSLLGFRQTWTVVCAKFIVDPVWWLYLFWIPDFLHRSYGLDLLHIGPPVVVIYLISDVGSVAGGWMSSQLMAWGMNTNRSRKLAMLVCACAALPVIFVYGLMNLWLAVIILGIAAAGHQGYSANLYTLASDLFPKRAFASVIGLGGMAAGVGGMLIAKFVGYVLQWSGSYMLPFFFAGCAYSIALIVLQILSPKLQPVELAPFN